MRQNPTRHKQTRLTKILCDRQRAAAEARTPAQPSAAPVRPGLAESRRVVTGPGQPIEGGFFFFGIGALAELKTKRNVIKSICNFVEFPRAGWRGGGRYYWLVIFWLLSRKD